MLEHFIIGFLLGIMSMLPIFPSEYEESRINFWRWTYEKLRRH